MGLRIAVTGASGFIGREVVARARDAGHDVLALSRGSGANYDDMPALARAFGMRDAVVHLAARAHRGGTDADFDCNVSAARSVAQACAVSGVRRLVLVSSIGVNGNATNGSPFTEADPPLPVEAYARSKFRAERVVQSLLDGSGTQWAIVRPPLVHGPGAPGNFGKLVRAVARGTPLPFASVRNRRSLIGVANLADLVLLCATQASAANELFLAADGDDLSTPQIVEAIARGVGRKARLWHVPPAWITAAAIAVGRRRLAESLCGSLQVDAAKARRVLGWQPAISSAEGIAQAAAAGSGAR